MALAILAEIPDISQEQYERVVKKVSETGSPAGALFHAGGPIEGGYRVVEVWESPAAVEAFYGSDLLKEASAGLPQPKVLMTWPVYGLDDGSGWRESRDPSRGPHSKENRAMITASGGIIQRPGEGRHFSFWSGEEFIWKVTGADADGVLDVGEMVVGPGIGVPEHIHHGNDETFYVLEGRFRLTVAGQEYNLEPGGFVFVPRGVRHVWVNNGSERARILLTFTPGGMDQFFVEINPLLQGPMDMERILPICAKYGYELVGPVPERP